MKQIKTYTWIARILGLAILLYLIIFQKSVQLPQEVLQTEQSGFSSIALFSFLVLGYIFSLYREKEGGIIIMFVSVIFVMYLMFKTETVPIALDIAIALLFLTGLLFYWIGKKKSVKNEIN